MKRTIYATVACDACGNPDDQGVAIAAERSRLLQLCNPCLYEMWQETQRAAQREKFLAAADEIEIPVTRKATYYGPDWQAIRERILERDGRTCQDEGHKRIGGSDERDKLVVHHRRPLREFDGNYEAANVAENLITLCTLCHGRWHAALNAEAKALQS